jgi:hypothetical protein
VARQSEHQDRFADQFDAVFDPVGYSDLKIPQDGAADATSNGGRRSDPLRRAALNLHLNLRTIKTL